MQIIGRQGRGCTPCGCPLHSHRSRGEAPMTRGSAAHTSSTPCGSQRGAEKCDTLAGSRSRHQSSHRSSPLSRLDQWLRNGDPWRDPAYHYAIGFLLLTPAGVQPTGRTGRTSRTCCPNTLSSDSNTGIRKDAYGANTPGGVPPRWSCIPIITQMQIIGRGGFTPGGWRRRGYGSLSSGRG